MARPKKFKVPVPLNLRIEKKIKEKAFRLAFDRKISVGQLFEQLVKAELKCVELELKCESALEKILSEIASSRESYSLNGKVLMFPKVVRAKTCRFSLRRDRAVSNSP
jgi:hypothetical protein